ncbi:hypothetical protein MANY_48950 [Mycolicibacterium anyangense]|uniref:Glycosyltransferase RgtA/B/C/D-like domain-containing protein n=1 Tax=Mycolicibacterium anyangense TaxID=1431246 RepID=A0A6N4WG90_9MYCO|nr:hypothetical protein MANY_48950 [Mycolicibacterium anyangense]
MFAALVGACVVYCIAISPFRPWLNLASRVPDDAAYYFQIAHNYVAGQGVTFDGRNPTNGFQPFWQVLIALMQETLPFRDQAEQFARAVLVFQGILLLAALMMFNRTLLFLDNQLLRRLGTLLFLTTVFLMVRDGMESALLVFLAAMVVHFQARNGGVDGWSTRACLTFGLLLGGVLLARLDSIFWIVGLFGVFVLMTGETEDARIRIRLAKAVWIGLACAAVVIPYLTVNYIVYGHFMPISGALKTSFPRPGFHLSEFSLTPDTRALLLLSVILSAACLLWELGHWPGGENGPLRLPACAMSLGVLLHVGYALLFMKWAVFSWHFVLERFAVCLLLPYLCAKIAPFFAPVLQRLAIGAMITILAIAAPLVVLQQDWRPDLSRSWKVTSYQASQWVKANLPVNAVIAMKDAGNMGFYSDRPVVNLDGLVNSFAYQEFLKRGQFRAFLRNSGVGYLVQHAFVDDPDVTTGNYVTYTFRSYSHLYDRPGGELQLRRSEEVYRSRPYYEGSTETVLVIWKIPSQDLGD